MLKTGGSRAGFILFIVSILVIGACSAIPFSIGPSGILAGSTPAPLTRCNANPAALCLVTFGFQEPDQMLIEFYVPPGTPFDFYLKIDYKGKRTVASCALAMDAITTAYCTSALLPLGANLGLEVYAAKSNVLLAKGQFVLSALELPTQVVGGTAEFRPTGQIVVPPSTPTTGSASSTPSSPAGFFTLTPQATSSTGTPTDTPPPETAYPNQ